MFKSEKTKIRVIFASIILLTLLAALVDFGKLYNVYAQKLSLPKMKEIQFRQGLDLLGGTHLVYKADVSEIKTKNQASAIEGVRDVIERRVNIFGVSEPNVQTSKTASEYRIIVELAGIKDISEAIKMIGETPLLEFKEENKDIRELTPEEQKAMDEFNKKAKEKANSALNRVLAGEDFSALAKEFSQDVQTKDKGGDMGWITRDKEPEIFAQAQNVSAQSAQGGPGGETGKTSNELFEDKDGYNIIKVEEKRAQKEEGGLGLDKKEIEASHILICYEGAEYCEYGMSKEDARKKAEDLKAQVMPGDFGDFAAQHSTEPGAEEGRGYLGWFTREMMVEPFSNVVFAQEVGTISDVVETQFGFHLIYKQDERTLQEYKIRRILVETQAKEDIVGPQEPWKNTELTGKYLKSASVQFNPNDNTPEVRLSFNNEGKDLFAEITKRNVNKPVAIFLDGFPISIPTVNEAITSGDAVITGKFTVKEATLLAQRLNAGALPVPIELISQQTVGASLGKESVDKSLKAGMIGLILVILFMLIIYRLPGVLAVISLGVYGLIILAIFKLWPVTLTLAGLAGFILSLGMAVDANILIFARFKEELKADKPMSVAISEAFRRAWPSIRDGNISTLLTCFVLIQFTTSVVKGFAITLGLGVLVSMFSAIVVTRVLMQVVVSEKMGSRRWLVGIKK